MRPGYPCAREGAAIKLLPSSCLSATAADGCYGLKRGEGKLYFFLIEFVFCSKIRERSVTLADGAQERASDERRRR